MAIVSPSQVVKLWNFIAKWVLFPRVSWTPRELNPLHAQNGEKEEGRNGIHSYDTIERLLS